MAGPSGPSPYEFGFFFGSKTSNTQDLSELSLGVSNRRALCTKRERHPLLQQLSVTLVLVLVFRAELRRLTISTL